MTNLDNYASNLRGNKAKQFIDKISKLRPMDKQLLDQYIGQMESSQRKATLDNMTLAKTVVEAKQGGKYVDKGLFKNGGDTHYYEEGGEFTPTEMYIPIVDGTPLTYDGLRPVDQNIYVVRTEDQGTTQPTSRASKKEVAKSNKKAADKKVEKQTQEEIVKMLTQEEINRKYTLQDLARPYQAPESKSLPINMGMPGMGTTSYNPEVNYPIENVAPLTRDSSNNNYPASINAGMPGMGVTSYTPGVNVNPNPKTYQLPKVEPGQVNLPSNVNMPIDNTRVNVSNIPVDQLNVPDRRVGPNFNILNPAQANVGTLGVQDRTRSNTEQVANLVNQYYNNNTHNSTNYSKINLDTGMFDENEFKSPFTNFTKDEAANVTAYTKIPAAKQKQLTKVGSTGMYDEFIDEKTNKAYLRNRLTGRFQVKKLD